jgi:hypothetical protein
MLCELLSVEYALELSHEALNPKGINTLVRDANLLYTVNVIK